MSSKSIQRRLIEASEIAAILRLTNSEVVAFSVTGYGIHCQLRPAAFGRVYRDLKVRKDKLDASLDDEHNLHVYFESRGVRWGTFVRAPDVAAWQAFIEAQRNAGIEHRPNARLGLPAPATNVVKSLTLFDS